MYEYKLHIKNCQQLKSCIYVRNTNLDPLFIVDPSDHLHTHLSDLVEVGLFQANIPQDLNDPLPHTYTRVLYGCMMT